MALINPIDAMFLLAESRATPTLPPDPTAPPTSAPPCPPPPTALNYPIAPKSEPAGRVCELLALASRLHGTLLDHQRPLWELHLIEGLEKRRFAVYAKIHHALVDGVSALRLGEAGGSG